MSTPDGGDGILLRRRIDFEADKEILMSLLDEKRIAHSFGTCVPIFQGSDLVFELSSVYVHSEGMITLTLS